jgi:drug/metabolite transporter (DMT)-like permease
MRNNKISYPPSVWIALVLVYLVWGSTYLAIRFAVASIPPFLMAGIRFLTSGFILFFFLLIKGERKPIFIHWKSAVIIGFFLLLIGNGGVSWVEQKMPSAIAALLVGTVPLWIALLEWAWKKGKRPSMFTWAGIFLGILGIFLLVFGREGNGDLQINPWAAGLLVFTSLAWAWGSLYARSAPLPSSALMSTAMEMIAGGLLQLIFGALIGEFTHFHISQITVTSAESWVYLSLIGSLVGFTSYIWVLQKANAELASTYAFVNPVIAVFLGWLFAGEALSPSLFLAAAFIIGAVVLITLAPGKRPKK